MANKGLTTMQRNFKEHMIRPIMCILYPEFADIIHEFNVSFNLIYTWVDIKAVRPAVYYGIDDRTKKERKNWSRPDPRELIEEKYTLNIGLDNHSQSPYKLMGKITWDYMEENFDCVVFRCWRFYLSYDKDRKTTPEQIEQVWKYLNTQGITKPTQEEFWTHYWSD